MIIIGQNKYTSARPLVQSVISTDLIQNISSYYPSLIQRCGSTAEASTEVTKTHVIQLISTQIKNKGRDNKEHHIIQTLSNRYAPHDYILDNLGATAQRYSKPEAQLITGSKAFSVCRTIAFRTRGPCHKISDK